MSTAKKFTAQHAKMQKTGASVFALSILIAQVTPALATIDNTATVSGTYNSSPVTATSSQVKVPVVTASGALTISAVMTAPTTSKGTDAGIVDANDTVDVTYTVTNTGNITLTSVTPDSSTFFMKFNGKTGTGNFGTVAPKTGTAPITLIPGASQDYVVTYTLSQLDVDRSAGLTGTTAVVTTANATGQTPSATAITPATAATANTNVTAGPKISVSKVAALPGSQTSVKLGDVVTYTYTVANVGNVALTTVSLNDQHGTPAVQVPLGTTNGGITGEALSTDGPLKAADSVSSSDATANDGKWDTLQPGATVTFTWAHTVTQAEIDHG